MDKQILEILIKIQADVSAIQSEMKDVNARLGSIESKFDILDAQLNNGFSQTAGRFNVIDDRLKVSEIKIDAVDAQVYRGFTEMTELSQSTDRRFDVIEKLVRGTTTQDVKYLSHKMQQIEKDVFLLNKDHQ